MVEKNIFFFKENRDMTHLRAGAEATRMQRALRSGQANAKKKSIKKKVIKKEKVRGKSCDATTSQVAWARVA